MAATPSTMLPLGTPAPDFTLTDTRTGQPVRLNDLRKGKKAAVVMFLCNHCPFVKHVRAELAALARDYASKGVAFVGISSNSVETHPADSPDLMKREALEAGYTFPYCYDESQEVAKAYRAACTPDFFVFDAAGLLAYRGQLDASRPGNGVPVTGVDIRAALDSLLADKPVSPDQRPSIGCNIKWKPGNAPDYA
ncbi:MAG: thioredoxin family protein [Phycisphaerales bacterium]